MRDLPETLEWYEECIQRNIHIHAQIPTECQPSIVYCHTGRRAVITPAKRWQQRKTSARDMIKKSQVISNEIESKVLEDVSTVNNSFIERLSQPMFNAQPVEITPTSQTVDISLFLFP